VNLRLLGNYILGKHQQFALQSSWFPA